MLTGLVNVHIHLWRTRLRDLAGDWISAEYHKRFHGNPAMRYTPEDPYLGTFVGAPGQIGAGTTCVFYWCHNNLTPDHADRSIDALMDSGTRTVFGRTRVPRP